MLSMVQGPTISIALAATDSDPIIMEHAFSDARRVAVLTPNTHAETATVQISIDFDVNYIKNGLTLAQAIAAANWDAAPTGGAALGAAGVPVIIDTSFWVAAAIRIHLDAPAAAAHLYKTYKQVENT